MEKKSDQEAKKKQTKGERGKVDSLYPRLRVGVQIFGWQEFGSRGKSLSLSRLVCIILRDSVSQC
jgi:hypothetical protein